VRTAYFGVLAAKELVFIGNQTVQNQSKHVSQIQNFVDAGTRPKIDLTSAQLNLANAELTSVRANNSLSLAKVQLNSAMGIEGPIDYDVVAPEVVPNPYEQRSVDQLADEAVAARPEIARIEGQLQQIEAQRVVAHAQYYPALVASSQFSGGTVDEYPSVPKIFPFGFNWYLGIALSCNLFSGFSTNRSIAELEATYESVLAQKESLRQSVRSEVEQQLLAVDESKHRLVVAERAVSTADERLKLAEGRYAAGASDVLELDDAQVTDANAKAERVTALYDLAIARARLARAMGNE
jgi:outer membrane protein